MTAVVVALNCRQPAIDIACEVAAHLSGYSIEVQRLATVWARASIKNGNEAHDAIRAAVATARNFYPPIGDDGECA